jgi:hypothetical protein
MFCTTTADSPHFFPHSPQLFSLHLLGSINPFPIFCSNDAKLFNGCLAEVKINFQPNIRGKDEAIGYFYEPNHL